MPFIMPRKDDMGVFDEVKANVLPRQVMEQSGVVFSRADMCKCPFHQDKTPSMKAKHTDKKYYCFGCGERGDAIDFVSKFYGIAPYDAAMQIADQFGISLSSSVRSPPKQIKREKSVKQILEESRSKTYRVLCEYRHMLNGFERDYSPTSIEEIDPRFEEAIKNLPFVEYLLDLLLCGTDSEKDFVVKDRGKEVTELERRVNEYRRNQRKSDYDRQGRSETVH